MANGAAPRSADKGRAVLERIVGRALDDVLPVQEEDGIDGAALLALDLPETSYLCRPWIPEGVLILAGRPKIGKTTLLRQIAVCVSSGTALWGSPCEQADVLFLSLEEGQKLMRKKLLAAGYQGAQVRRILFHWKWRPGAFGVGDIRERLKACPAIRLVIVDSLTRFRDAPTRDKPQFHQDYEAVRLLADIAKDHPGLSIIVLHHTRKDQGDDAIADISGTFGLSAAADNYMVLRREGGDFVLHCGGRYWDEAQDAFLLRRDAGAWALEGAALAVPLSPMQRRYFDRLQAEGTITTRGMATRFGVSDSTASLILGELRDKGMVERTTDGWRVI
jgi:RecA-family ATPase